MQNKTIDVLYIFNEGRKQKLDRVNDFSRDFYYYYFNFLDEDLKTDCIEIESDYVIKKNNFFFIFEKILRKFTGLPFYGSKLLNKSNIKKIKESRYIILTNETTVYSTFFYFLINKNKLNFKSTIFLMGITDKEKSLYKNFVKKFFIKSIFKNSNNILFLGEGEIRNAQLKFKNYSNKMHFFPFTVDQNFWKGKDINSKKNNKILFVGNDKNRDYKFLKLLSEHMEEYKFTFVSNNPILENIVSENVEVIKGNWRSGILTDLDLLNIYNESILCILPIQETVQPSGQSVALQAISAKVPVIITKTSGFWDSKNFIHNKNIIFIKKNEIDLWKKQIELIVNDLKFLDNISKNAYKTISENYKNTDYFKKLKGLVIQ